MVKKLIVAMPTTGKTYVAESDEYKHIVLDTDSVLKTYASDAHKRSVFQSNQEYRVNLLSDVERDERPIVLTNIASSHYWNSIKSSISDVVIVVRKEDEFYEIIRERDKNSKLKYSELIGEYTQMANDMNGRIIELSEGMFLSSIMSEV